MPQFIKILKNLTSFKYLNCIIDFNQAAIVLKMRWVLKQLMDETIWPTAAIPEINCKMFIDLTGQSRAVRLHRNHGILECFPGHGPVVMSTYWDQTENTHSCPPSAPHLGWAPRQWCWHGVSWGASPSHLRDRGAEVEHTSPELRRQLLCLVPNPSYQQKFLWILHEFLALKTFRVQLRVLLRI